MPLHNNDGGPIFFASTTVLVEISRARQHATQDMTQVYIVICSIDCIILAKLYRPRDVREKRVLVCAGHVRMHYCRTASLLRPFHGRPQGRGSYLKCP